MVCYFFTGTKGRVCQLCDRSAMNITCAKDIACIWRIRLTSTTNARNSCLFHDSVSHHVGGVRSVRNSSLAFVDGVYHALQGPTSFSCHELFPLLSSNPHNVPGSLCQVYLAQLEAGRVPSSWSQNLHCSGSLRNGPRIQPLHCWFLRS